MGLFTRLFCKHNFERFKDRLYTPTQELDKNGFNVLRFDGYSYTDVCTKCNKMINVEKGE